MATYLQGVTPYIPQIQPFQEDLNFYSNVLSTKQQQYDSNYKKLNEVYGQYFYADLSREGNIEKKEQLLKNINFELQRVAGMDLSLQQNIDQAVQVFKPFYEDKVMMKDMAWTKNYNREKGFATGLLRSSDEKRNSQYWETGVRALDYRRAEFSESSDEESMNFGNVRYTPYVNATKEAMAIAKEAGLSVETINMSPDGKWIIKQKNGQALTEPLSKLFEATLGKDPRIQKVYQTQAYVNRKDYAYTNAAQFNGDVKAAEMKYLEDSYNMFKEQARVQKKQLETTSTIYENKIRDIEKQIAAGTADPKAKMYLEQLKSNKDINDSALERMSSMDESLSEESSTAMTNSGFKNPYGDLQSLRNKIDAAMASSLMQKDLGEAAQIFAYRNSSTDMTANPYTVNEQKHRFQMAQIAARGAQQERVARIKARLDRKNLFDAEKLKTGDYHIEQVPILDANGNQVVDPVTGQPAFEEVVVVNPGADELFDKPSGETSTPEKNMKNMSRAASKDQVNAYLVPAFKNLDYVLSELKNAKSTQISDAKIKELLGGRTLEQFRAMYQKYPEHFSRNVLGAEGISEIMNNVSAYFNDEQNANLEVVKAVRSQFERSMVDATSYTAYLKADQDWRKETSKVVMSELKANNYKGAEYLYKENGELRTKEEFYDEIREKTGESPYTVRQASSADLRPIYLQGMSTEDGGTERKTVLKAGMPDYDDLKKAAGVVYMDSKRITAPPTIKSNSLGTGISTNMQAVEVTPNSPWLKGYSHFASTTKTLRGLDWGDTDKVSVRATGFGTKSKMSEEEQRTLNLIGRDMFNQLAMDFRNSKSKLGNFILAYSNIAEGSPNRAAFEITPDAKWLNEYFNMKMQGATKDQKEAYFNIKEKIAKNGLAIVSDKSDFLGNSLAQAATMGPIEAAVNYSKDNKFTYTDPVSDSKVTIEKDPSGVTAYKVNMDFMTYNPDTGNFELQMEEGNSLEYSVGINGQTPDAVFDEFYSNLSTVHEFNRAAMNKQNQQ